MNVNPVCENCRREAALMNHVYVPVPSSLYSQLETFLRLIYSPGSVEDLIVAIVDGYVRKLRM
jgi:hypothetical protein